MLHIHKAIVNLNRTDDISFMSNPVFFDDMINLSLIHETLLKES